MNRILMVEDNPINRSLVLAILRHCPYQIVESSSAEEGLEKISQQDFDLVLMDVGLPGMDGVEATRILKTTPKTAHVPVVILSAYAMAEEKQRAMDAGCDTYLTKPIDLKLFRSVVEKFLYSSRQNSTNSENLKTSVEFRQI